MEITAFFSYFLQKIKVFQKKVAKKFAHFRKTHYLCTRNREIERTASVAQLVRAPDC